MNLENFKKMIEDTATYSDVAIMSAFVFDPDDEIEFEDLDEVGLFLAVHRPELAEFIEQLLNKLVGSVATEVSSIVDTEAANESLKDDDKKEDNDDT